MFSVSFVYTGGRRKRWEAFKRGKSTPLEFLYGFPYLVQEGVDARLWELEDFHCGGSVRKMQAQINSLIGQRTGFISSSHHFCRGASDLIGASDWIIAGNEYVATGLAGLFPQITSKLLFFAMGQHSLIESSAVSPLLRSLGRYLYRRLLRSADRVVFLGEGEFDAMRRRYPSLADRFVFLPFGIDTDFWSPGEGQETRWDFAFVGNDKWRNFPLVLEITRAMPSKRFCLVSRKIAPESCPANVTLMQGDLKRAPYSDETIRDVYWQSSVVFLPLQESTQPSGQSVCLQAMASQRPVVISRTAGFWDPDRFMDGEHLFFLKGDASLDEWIQSLSHINADSALRQRVAASGAKLIRGHYGISDFGSVLLSLINE